MAPRVKIADDNYRADTMDLKRFFYKLFTKLWVILAVTAAGAAIGAIIYIVYTSITNGETKYRACSDYYITFNEADYPNGMDYYNAYTWNQFVTDDKIVDYVMGIVPDGITKEDVVNSVSSVMMGDYRVLTVQVTNTDKTKVGVISEAYKKAMPNFAEEVNELTEIKFWSEDEIVVLKENTKAGNAALLGGIIALIAASVGFAVYYSIDDRIYVERDFKKAFPNVPFIGYEATSFAKDTEFNKKKIIGRKDSFLSSNVSADMEVIKKHKSCVLVIEWGEKCATAIQYDMDLLDKQGIPLVGVIMTRCNDKFLNYYYGRKIKK